MSDDVWMKAFHNECDHKECIDNKCDNLEKALILDIFLFKIYNQTSTPPEFNEYFQNNFWDLLA